MIDMDKYIRWQDVKDTMTALTEEERTEVDLMADIISQIIERRQEMGLSQRDLEKLTGVRQEVICRIENLKNVPQLDTLIRLMEPLGLRFSITKH